MPESFSARMARVARNMDKRARIRAAKETAMGDPPVQPTEPLRAMRKLGKRELVSAEDMQAYAQEQAARHAHPPVQPTEPVALSVIRKWPEGFEARLQAVWVDVIGFIPTVKLYDLQRVLAEFGFRMEVYEDAAHPPVQPTEPVAWKEEDWWRQKLADFPGGLSNFIWHHPDAAAQRMQWLEAHPPVQPPEPNSRLKQKLDSLVKKRDHAADVLNKPALALSYQTEIDSLLEPTHPPVQPTKES